MQLTLSVVYLAILALLALVCPANVWGETFPLPEGNDTAIGGMHYTQVRKGETLVDIAREFNLGYDQIVRANPGVNRWVPDEGAKILLPHQYILVGNVRRGIVLNIAELRLYFYPNFQKGDLPRVITHPVSIGRMDWRTPLGRTSVTKKERDPPWRPPPSIRREHALEGDPLPEVIAGGAPDNPLGRFALRLGFPSYLIHGVDERKAYGIGMRVTHGCIRMYPEDIESLFGAVAVGTPVMIVNEPMKIGRQGDNILLEVHQPLEEGEDEAAPEAPRISAEEAVLFVRERLRSVAPFDEGLVASVAERGDGIPTVIAQTSEAIPGMYDAGLRDTLAQRTEPSPRKSSLDEELEKAVARHLQEDKPPLRAEAPAPQPQRRSARQREEPISDVQQYLQERY
jgi:L,D-transpeptidase ErfK/SrfK